MSAVRLNRPEFDQAVKETYNAFAKSDAKRGLNKFEFSSLCAAVPASQLKFQQTTQIIDYLFDQSDKDKDARVSLLELQEMLYYFYIQP